MMPEHQQVFFQPLKGEPCTVDAGMFDILTVLKGFGVATQFSCEDNLGTGYILADGRSARRFERLARRLYSKGKLSLYTAELVNNFTNGNRTLEVSHFINDGCDEYGLLNRHRKANSKYSVETCYSYFYGYRICYRWPIEDTEQLYQALLEITRLTNTPYTN